MRPSIPLEINVPKGKQIEIYSASRNKSKTIFAGKYRAMSDKCPNGLCSSDVYWVAFLGPELNSYGCTNKALEMSGITIAHASNKKKTNFFEKLFKPKS